MGMEDLLVTSCTLWSKLIKPDLQIHSWLCLKGLFFYCTHPLLYGYIQTNSAPSLVHAKVTGSGCIAW